MPVSVSLLDLVCIPNTEHLWPEVFRGMNKQTEENPDDRVTFGVIADWLEEEPQKETELAKAYRWMHKRPEIPIVFDGYYKSWDFSKGTMPNGVSIGPEFAANNKMIDRSHISGVMADLALRLVKLQQTLEA